MTKRRGFFTPEMGSWLREIRVNAELTQDEVAERMGTLGKGRSNQISALEMGRIQHPSFEHIVRYLLACGAPMGRFCDKFNTIGLLPVDPKSFDNLGLPVEVEQRLLARASGQVDKYQRRMRFPKKGRPVRPEGQQKAAGKYRDYQVQVKIIQRAVQELLAETGVDATEIQAYLDYARMVLSTVRKYRGNELDAKLDRISGYLDLHGLEAQIGERIRRLVVKRFAATNHA
jgi:transcriptional regulator with XRE-family HTH domain